MAEQPDGLPRLLCQRTAIKVLGAAGWVQARGGKHVVKMRKPGHRPITLPAAHGEDYSLGLTRSIYRAAGLLNDDEGSEV